MPKKKLKLRLGDLLLDPEDKVGVILVMPKTEQDAIVVHWFADNESYAYSPSMVAFWRQRALDRRSEFL